MRQFPFQQDQTGLHLAINVPLLAWNISDAMSHFQNSTLWGKVAYIERRLRQNGTGSHRTLKAEVITAVVTYSSIFWNIYQCFRPVSRPSLPWFTLRAWTCMWHVLPKHRSNFNGLHGVISHKTELVTF
jgi:hypothetical protein